MTDGWLRLNPAEKMKILYKDDIVQRRKKKKHRNEGK
jgi:hypothetical protein